MEHDQKLAFGLSSVSRLEQGSRQISSDEELFESHLAILLVFVCSAVGEQEM